MTHQIFQRAGAADAQTLHRMEKMLAALEVSGLPRVRSLEDMLRDYQSAMDDLPLDEVHHIHERILQVGPFAHSLRQLLSQTLSPEQIFQELLDQTPLQELVDSTRVLGSHLALASGWESRGEVRRSAAMFGLLLRLGLASGNEDLIARSSARLDVILQCQPEFAALSMEHARIELLRKSWRLWGASQHTNHPRMLARLAERFQQDEEPSQERLLGEIAIWERLLVGAGRSPQSGHAQAVTPCQRSRALLRLIELYHKIAPTMREVAQRGLDLLPRWAAACRHRPALPVQTWSLMEYASDFELSLRQAGSTRSRARLTEHLNSVYLLLSQRWPREMAVGQLCLWLGQLRRELLGSHLDPERLASAAQLLREGEQRSRDPQLKMKLRGECYRALSRWLQLGERAAVMMATEMLAQYAEEVEDTEVLLQRAEVLLHIPGTPRQRMHNAHQCRKLAKRALRDSEQKDRPSQIAHSLLLRGRANVVLSRERTRISMQPTLAWLRRGINLLKHELKHNNHNNDDRELLARSLMTLAYVEVTEARRWTDWSRTKLAEQALHDARQSLRLFKNLECSLRSAETLWIQYHALLHIRGDLDLTHYSEAESALFEAQEMLKQHRYAFRYAGIHVEQGTLFENVRNDYIQICSCRPHEVGLPLDGGIFHTQELDSISLDTHDPRATHIYESTPKVCDFNELSYVV